KLIGGAGRPCQGSADVPRKLRDGMSGVEEPHGNPAPSQTSRERQTAMSPADDNRAGRFRRPGPRDRDRGSLSSRVIMRQRASKLSPSQHLNAPMPAVSTCVVIVPSETLSPLTPRTRLREQ